jgi:type IV pilus assembly protein PilA
MKKLKEKLSAKLSKNGGFTLVEMLIVVAIIAILVAVSIPLVGSAMEKAREATDAANERAAKMAIVSAFLGNDSEIITDSVTAGTKYWYDAVNGKLVDSSASGATKPDEYGSTKNPHGDSCQCTTKDTTAGHHNKVIHVTIATNGSVTLGWE